MEEGLVFGGSFLMKGCIVPRGEFKPALLATILGGNIPTIRPFRISDEISLPTPTDIHFRNFTWGEKTKDEGNAFRKCHLSLYYLGTRYYNGMSTKY